VSAAASSVPLKRVLRARVTCAAIAFVEARLTAEDHYEPGRYFTEVSWYPSFGRDRATYERFRTSTPQPRAGRHRKNHMLFDV
jgi:hypothetical protein